MVYVIHMRAIQDARVALAWSLLTIQGTVESADARIGDAMVNLVL
jgi:hypothetical protein